MTLKNNLILSLFIYTFVQLSPILVGSLGEQAVIIFSTIVFILGTVLLIFINSKLSELPLIEQKKPTSLITTIIYGLIGILLVMIVQTIASLVEQNLFNIAPTSANTQMIGSIVSKYPYYLVIVSIAGPIMEEFIFRRSITGLLNKRIPLFLSATISSSLFALIHLDGHFLLYFAMGMTFFFLYQTTKNIWTPIIAHCGMNALVMIAQFM